MQQNEIWYSSTVNSIIDLISLYHLQIFEVQTERYFLNKLKVWIFIRVISMQYA